MFFQARVLNHVRIISNMHHIQPLTVLLIMSVFNPSTHADPSLPLPGKGLEEHPFLYAGE